MRKSQYSPHYDQLLFKYSTWLLQYFLFISLFEKSTLIAISRVRLKILFYCDKYLSLKVIVHYDTSAMTRFLTSVSLQHEPKASDVITLVKKTFHRTSIVRNFISRGVKMRISAREACVKPHVRTRSDIKNVSLTQKKNCPMVVRKFGSPKILK